MINYHHHISRWLNSIVKKLHTSFKPSNADGCKLTAAGLSSLTKPLKLGFPCLLPSRFSESCTTYRVVSHAIAVVSVFFTTRVAALPGPGTSEPVP